MNEESLPGDIQQQAAAAPLHDNVEAHSMQAPGEQNVPLAALQAERAQRQKMEDELRLIKDHLSLMQATQNRPVPERQKDEFEDRSDNDVMTWGEGKKVLQKLNAQYQMSIDELRVSQKYQDYQEVVTRYLPEVLKNNPSLQGSLQKTQDYELAYYLAKNSDSYKSEHKKQKRNADAERILQNAQASGSLSSVGGTSPIQSAKKYKDMSDEDFRKEINRNLGYA